MNAKHYRLTSVVVVLVLGLMLWVAVRVPTYYGGESRKPEDETSAEISHELQEVSRIESEVSAADFCAARARPAPFPSSVLTPEQTEARAELDAAAEEIRERLANSTDEELLLVAAMLEEPTDRMELFTRAMRANSGNALVVWYAVDWCSEYHEQLGCPLTDWENQLLLLDSQNSEAWIRVAANRLEADEEQAALRALQQAAAASETRIYWPESIEMFERALAAAGGSSFSVRASSAIGFAASHLPNYGDYVNMCREQSAKSQEWAYACLAYGESSKRQGRTVIGLSIAESIQEIALESLADERLAEVTAKNELDYEARLAIVTDSEKLAALSIPSIFFGYLNAHRARGEVEAMAYLREEADRWLARYESVECGP